MVCDMLYLNTTYISLYMYEEINTTHTDQFSRSIPLGLMGLQETIWGATGDPNLTDNPTLTGVNYPGSVRRWQNTSKSARSIGL